MLKAEDVKKLIEDCLKSNPISQKKLFDTFSAKMYAICLRYASDEEQAKDILQEGFIRVFKSLTQFRFGGSFEGWMKRVFVNTAIEIYRKNSKNPEELGIEYYENLGYNAHILERLNEKDLLDLVRQLPAGYRTVFNLFILEGYSHQEIANKLEITESTSKSQLRKARIYLMKMLNDQK